MSDSPTAGSRLLQQLKATASPSTAGILQQKQPAQSVPQPQQATPQPQTYIPDSTAQATFEDILTQVEQQATQQTAQDQQPEQATLDAAVQAAAPVTTTPAPQSVSPPVQPDPLQQQQVADQTPVEERTIINPGALAQSLPVAVQQPTAEELQQQQFASGGPRKEAIEGARSASVVEAAPSTAGVEVEKSAEIPPEVESYIEEVIDHAEQAPEEIVIAEDTVPDQPAAPVSRTVKVLPLTKAQAEMAKRKNPTFSIRWLYEFSDKIAKIFAGGVTYRPDNG